MNFNPANDPLLPVVRDLILQHQNPSVAFLQRMLTLPYQRASCLMQYLEGDLVSAPDAAGWRHILAAESGAQCSTKK